MDKNKKKCNVNRSFISIAFVQLSVLTLILILIISGSPYFFTGNINGEFRQPYSASLTPTTVSAIASNSSVLSAYASAYPMNGSTPLTVQFYGNASGGAPPYYWQWNFDDGAISSSENPIHTYQLAGTYDVILTVTDNTGVSAYANLTVTVSNSSVKSPNGTLSSFFLAYYKVKDLTTNTAISSGGYIKEGDKIQFTVSALALDSPFTYRMNFGNGANRSIQTTLSMVFLNYTYPVAVSNATAVTIAPSLIAVNSEGYIAQYESIYYVVNYTSSRINNSSFSVQTSIKLPSNPYAPSTVTFLTIIHGGIPSYTIQWNFGDGNYGSSLPGMNITHTYTTAGIFHPSLMVTDSVNITLHLYDAVITVKAINTAEQSSSATIITGNYLLMGIIGGVIAGVIVVIVGNRWRNKRSPKPKGDENGYNQKAQTNSPEIYENGIYRRKTNDEFKKI